MVDPDHTFQQSNYLSGDFKETEMAGNSLNKKRLIRTAKLLKRHAMLKTRQTTRQESGEKRGIKKAGSASL
ncbi:hypothetical protein ACI0ZQ_000883 [Cronobacter dublinensis]